MSDGTTRTIKLSRRQILEAIEKAASQAYHDELFRQLRRHFPTEEITISGATIDLIKPKFPVFEVHGVPVEWVSE